MIFVGEHTSYTHAWIASALESGIRGSVQLLLGLFNLHLNSYLLISNAMVELGLVDEAKAATEKWMARWIDVVSLSCRTALDGQLAIVTSIPLLICGSN